MTNTFEENLARQNTILAAAAGCISRFGFDKTSMNDVAESAHLTRAIVYQYFPGKEALFDALLFREMQQYALNWSEALAADPQANSLGAVFRAVLVAVHHSPFITAMLTHDRSIFGQYLAKPGNLFADVQPTGLWVGLLTALQQAGAIREDVNVPVFAHLMTALAYGLLSYPEDTQASPAQSFEDVIESAAGMIERALAPQKPPEPGIGQAVIRQFAEQAFSQIQSPRPIQTNEGNLA